MEHSVEEVKLANGAQGLFVHVPGGKVMSAQLEFRAGEYLVPKAKWETPHLLEHTILGANQEYPKARRFQAEIEKNGAYSNASTSVYDIVYDFECADFEWDRMLELQLVSLTKPLFLQEEFAAEFGNVREELLGKTSDRFRHVTTRLREAYGLVAQTDRERLKSMRNVKLGDVKKHYQATHTPGNLRFIIAGALSPLRKKAITELFSKLDLPEGRERLELPDEHPAGLAKTEFIYSRHNHNVCFHIDTFMSKRLSDQEKYALDLANTMLTVTLWSRIYAAARERGLVYDIISGYDELKKGCNWWFEAQVSKRNAPLLFDVIVLELKKMLAGEIADTDIENAKGYALGTFQRKGQTVREIAETYSSRYFFDGTIEDYYQIPEKIRAATKPAVVSAARQMFAERIWGLGVLSNCKQSLVDELHARLASLWV